MDLSEYVDALRAHLTTCAAAGTEQTQETARLLGDSLEPAVRLAVTDALATMAAEVTAAWDGGSVDILIRGRDPEVVVTAVPLAAPAEAPPATEPPAEDGDGSISRISLRLPESLKGRAEAAAATEGVSLNTWLVRAVAAAVQPPPPDSQHSRSTRRITGFARS